MRSTKNRLSQDEIRKMREADNKIVKGIFRCFEPVGGSMKFSFLKYKGDDVQTYVLEDGKTYDLPLMVARHLNRNCWYPRHQYILDANGNPRQDVGKRVKRCGFESLEFAQDEAISNGDDPR